MSTNHLKNPQQLNKTLIKKVCVISHVTRLCTFKVIKDKITKIIKD